MGQSNSPHLFCFGLGYTGMALARQLASEGWRVSGTCRDPIQAKELTASGITAFVFSGDGPGSHDIVTTLSEATHLLSTVPPSTGDSGDPVLRVFGSHLSNLKNLSWIGYLSTTGVYGDTGGAIVTEQTPTAPSGPRGERRVAAEQSWLSLYRDYAAPIHMFRLPGIYGPRRSSIDQVRGGTARRIHKPGHQFNRIHVDDIAQTLRASMDQPNSGAIYNVCDDESAAPADVTAYACTLMGAPPPPLVPFSEARETMSDMTLSFWRDTRQVSNARIKDELGVVLKYPSYREGLAAIWAEESAP